MRQLLNRLILGAVMCFLLAATTAPLASAQRARVVVRNTPAKTVVHTPNRRVVISKKPPANHRETRRARPSNRHVWISGNWRYHGGRYVWVSGRYAVPPHGQHVWVPGHYTKVPGGWVWVPGHWR